MEFLMVGSSWLQIISCKDTGSFFSHQQYVKTRNLIYSVLLDAICSCLFNDLVYKQENASLPLNLISEYHLFKYFSDNLLHSWEPALWREHYKSIDINMKWLWSCAIYRLSFEKLPCKGRKLWKWNTLTLLWILEAQASFLSCEHLSLTPLSM